MTADSEIERDSKTARRGVRFHALLCFVAAAGFLALFMEPGQIFWAVGIATFLVGSGLLWWKAPQMADSRTWSDRSRVPIVVAYLAALLMFLVSIVLNQKLVPSIVFGVAALGMAALVAGLPSLLSDRPAA